MIVCHGNFIYSLVADTHTHTHTRSIPFRASRPILEYRLSNVLNGGMDDHVDCEKCIYENKHVTE